ncbi:ABC transporter permease [Glutamicibacter endophyticus]|uniref:ABC transporter permease n=1 Tax=Glutamicibacter endophyticus TaxID=1522174 RepID=UPI003AF0A006
MNPRTGWRIVALREIETKVRDKAFVLTTLGTLALIIGSIVVAGVLSSRTASYSVIATDETSFQVLTEARDTQPEGIDLSILRMAQSAAELRLEQEQVTALLGTDDQGRYTLTGKDAVPGELRTLIGDSLSTVLTEQLLQQQGVADAELPRASDLRVAQLHGDADRSSMVRAMALIFSFLFYMASLMFGMPIANSVIEEKQNRVVEILASAIPLRQLLAGKILGNVVLALLQLLLFLAIGLAAAYLSPIELPFLGVVSQVAGWFVVFFLGGFLLLAGVWAALGSLATRTEDLQQSSGPIIAVLMAVLFLGLYASGQLLVVASYIPIASSVAMPIRLLSGEVPWWEPALSLGIMALSCWVVLRFAERIYRRAVMHTEGTLSIKKALQIQL